MSSEGIMDEGPEIIMHAGDDTDASSENDTSTDTGEETDDDGEMSSHCSSEHGQ
jgi:hypothetical protein